MKDKVWLRGIGMDTTIYSESTAYIILASGVSNWKISDLQIFSIKYQAHGIVIDDVAASNMTIENCWIENNHPTANLGAGIYIEYNDTNLLERIYIRNNYVKKFAYAVRVRNGAYIWITDNYFEEQNGMNIRVKYSGREFIHIDRNTLIHDGTVATYGNLFEDCNYSTFNNNLVDGGGGAVTGVQIHSNCGNWIIDGNQVHGATSSQLVNASGTSTLGSNDT